MIFGFLMIFVGNGLSFVQLLDAAQILKFLIFLDVKYPQLAEIFFK